MLTVEGLYVHLCACLSTALLKLCDTFFATKASRLPRGEGMEEEDISEDGECEAKEDGKREGLLQ